MPLSNKIIFGLLIVMLSMSLSYAETFDIQDFGAKGDGQTLNTTAIQAAIDKAFDDGGGTVLVQDGTYVSGTIILKSNVTLFIESGATLLASPNLVDYPDITPEIPYQYTHRFTRYLIYAENAENITITGQGTIDGRGRNFPYIRGEDKNRPYIIRFAECKNVTVRDVTFLDSARWLQHYLGCEDVVIDGITVLAPTRENRDGIDIDSCNKVRISNCNIDSGDDAIVLKATAMRPCQNVTVTNCVLRSQGASALKLGTESNGGFENILFDNCTVYDTGGDAIALEMVDGGAFDRVTVSNINIKNARTAIFVRLGNRARPIPGIDVPEMGAMRNIIIDNIQATDIGNWGCSITGLPDHPVENITISNVHIQFKGGGTLADAAKVVPEKPEAYPSSKMFEMLPAYGFYCRHVSNMNLKNITLSVATPDYRPALICDDVQNLDITDVDASLYNQAPSFFRFSGVHDASVVNCRPIGTCRLFVAIDSETRGVSLFANDLRRTNKIVTPDYASAVYIGDNLK